MKTDINGHDKILGNISKRYLSKASTYIQSDRDTSRLFVWLTLFLKQRGDYQDFIREFALQNDKSITSELGNKHPGDFIDMSFVFTNTKAGYYYWQDVSLNWREYLETKVKEDL